MEDLSSLKLADLKDLAKQKGIKGYNSLKKSELVDILNKQSQVTVSTPVESTNKARPQANKEDVKQQPSNKNIYTDNMRKSSSASKAPVKNSAQRRSNSNSNKEIKSTPKEKTIDINLNNTEQTNNKSIENTENTEAKKTPIQGVPAHGILEVLSDGYGFIRSDNFLSGDNDVYVAPSVIRRFGLRTGDVLDGTAREKSQTEKFGALIHVDKVNGILPDDIKRRYSFKNMTPIFPDSKLKLENDNSNVAMRIMDLICPIGKDREE